jgi:hypothetical protein
VVRPIFQANLRKPLPRRPQRSSEIFAAQEQRHGYIFCSRKISQQLVALPEKPHRAVSKLRKRRVIGVSSAASKCKSVLLPAPDGATMATISPRRKLRFASDKTARLFSPLP